MLDPRVTENERNTFENQVPMQPDEANIKEDDVKQEIIQKGKDTP